jgi:hypothetical protein
MEINAPNPPGAGQRIRRQRLSQCIRYGLRCVLRNRRTLLTVLRLAVAIVELVRKMFDGS